MTCEVGTILNPRVAVSSWDGLSSINLITLSGAEFPDHC
jgi:hypothetical protein